ncbi:hypothetical protein D3C76_1367650 [compost metagenome]
MGDGQEQQVSRLRRARTGENADIILRNLQIQELAFLGALAHQAFAADKAVLPAGADVPGISSCPDIERGLGIGLHDI